jgi:hypothetical protein
MNSPLRFVSRGAKAWGMARRHSPRHPLFRQRWFADDIIITCVRWYLRVGRFLGATKDPREVITDVDARYYGLVVNDQSLTPGANPRIGATSFEDWLNRYLTQKKS